jgi:hypothetical protein
MIAIAPQIKTSRSILETALRPPLESGEGLTVEVEVALERPPPAREREERERDRDRNVDADLSRRKAC